MKLTQTLKNTSLTTCAAATATLMLALTPATSSAVDFGGYFRAGPGATSTTHGARDMNSPAESPKRSRPKNVP